jgi:hypothetical protein
LTAATGSVPETLLTTLTVFAWPPIPAPPEFAGVDEDDDAYAGPAKARPESAATAPAERVRRRRLLFDKKLPFSFVRLRG